MNRSRVLELLSEYITYCKVSGSKKTLKRATVYLDKAGEDDVVFYRINSNLKSVQVFEERAREYKFGIIVVSSIDELDPGLTDVIVVSPEHFLICQKIILDELLGVKPLPHLIGVTGTNGKTTTTLLLAQLFEGLGAKAAGIGTLGLYKNKKFVDCDFITSPSYVEVRNLINDLNACDVIVFEVSSHALAQDRFFEIKFDAGIFTSFGQDHLEFHKDIDDYFLAKMKLFNEKLVKKGKKIINFVDSGLREFLKKNSYKDSDFSCVDDKYDLGQEVPLFFQAKYNKMNLLLALRAVSHHQKKSIENILSKVNIKDIVPPSGRFSTFEYRGGNIIVDYAHTPDALKNLLSEIQEIKDSGKIITVFGCGGDRDREKRSIMGDVVANLSDLVIVTSDNPRNENPESIIKDVVKNFSTDQLSSTISEVDRERAIKLGFSHLERNDFLVIAGKGHESYQELEGGRRIDFSDIEIVKNTIGGSK